jgi:hypothetical protein
MSTAIPHIVAPSPAEVDSLAEEWIKLESEIDDLEKESEEKILPKLTRLGELRKLFTEQVRAFGSAHAGKSKILHGLSMEIMATFGSSTSIDAAAVETFRKALAKAKQTRLLKKIFEKTERWTMLDNAGIIIRSTKLADSLLALYSKCTVQSPNKPKLVVRSKEKAR